MDEIKQRASGSTFAEISKKNFRPINVVVPTSNILFEFEKQAKLIYDKITESESENASLINIRDSLLPKLLSGQIEV
jgi:type I restriction enzyme S subunit